MPSEAHPYGDHPLPWLKWGLVALLLVGLAAVWRFTPLHGLLEESHLAALAARLQGTHLALVAVLAVYVLGGLAMMPVAVLAGTCGLIFGPWWGFGYAMAGSLASALILYWVGGLAGSSRMHRWSGGKLGHLGQHMADHSITTITLARILPVAPFSLVNLAAGAAQVRFGPYCLGSLLGILPNTLAITVFADRLRRIWSRPHWLHFAEAAAVLALLALLTWGLKRLLNRRPQARSA